MTSRPADERGAGWRTVDWAGVVCLLVGAAAAGVLVVEPTQLVTDVTWGQLFVPMWGSGRWATPLGLLAVVAALLFLVRCWTARRPLVDLRGWWARGAGGRPARSALPGARRSEV